MRNVCNNGTLTLSYEFTPYMRQVFVTVAAQTSATALVFSYDGPSITIISTATPAATQGGALLTLTGTSFGIFCLILLLVCNDICPIKRVLYTVNFWSQTGSTAPAVTVGGVSCPVIAPLSNTQVVTL